MKATGQYFPVVLFIMLYKVVLTLKSVQYFVVVLFISINKVVLTFESVDEILKCDHSNESYRAVLSHGTILHNDILLNFDYGYFWQWKI